MKKLKNLNKKYSLGYPINFFEKIKDIPANHACPCSVIFQNNEIGGILINCTSKDLEDFKIKPNAPLEPLLNFKMFDYQKLMYVLEIMIEFDNVPNRNLKMHFNPYNSNVKEFFKLVLSNQMISLHFNNLDSDILISGITNFDDDEIKWFERNYKLISEFTSQNKSFTKFSEILEKDLDKTDVFFKYYRCKKHEYFINNGDFQIML